jgi:ribosome-binding factor A
MPRGFDRTQRVADLVQKALAQILVQEDDPELRLVTIISVDVSRDLSYAKVYVSVMLDEPEKVEHIVRKLNQSVKDIRYSLARAIKARIVPELKFIYDDSTKRGFNISSLIESAMKKTDKK